MLMFRLNYAIDMRYGVLFDIASAVLAHRPVDRSIGYVNCIWQGDAAEYAIRCLLHCDTPPTLLNVTGPESISVTYIANQFAERFNVPVSFTGAPSDSSLFSNAGKMAQLLGYPSVSLNQMLDWTAEWLINGGNTIDAPTHFEQRNGNY
jgi:nucleoside-diphosphate-sugar epimerase